MRRNEKRRSERESDLEREDWRLEIGDCGLEIGDCGLETVDCRLRTGDCGLWTGDCGLWTGDCGLETVDWRTDDGKKLFFPVYRFAPLLNALSYNSSYSFGRDKI